MKSFINIGRLLYSIGIIAVGTHQLLLKNFRPEILPSFPAWAHDNVVFPILASIALIFSGIIISGLIKMNSEFKKCTCLYLGFSFLILVIFCQVPYVLFFSPDKISRLDVWFNAAEELAYSGGAFVMAGSFSENNFIDGKKNIFQTWLEKLIPFGRIFFAILMFIFGCSHFVFTSFVSTMVPKWAGAPLFWTYFFGAALIAASLAIIFKIWIRLAAILLAISLLIFFICFHVPDAIANFSANKGNEVVRATVALLFCGIALVISSTTIIKATNNNSIHLADNDV